MAAQRSRTMATMTAEEATARIVQLEVDQSITKTELLDALRELEQQKRTIGDNIDMAFASVKNRLDALINDTSRELSNLNNANKELLNRTSNAVDTLDVRLKAVENWVQQSGPSAGYGVDRDRGEYRQKGYLPIKNTIPETLSNDPTKWRAWKRDVLGYFDSITRGLKSYLLEI